MRSFLGPALLFLLGPLAAVAAEKTHQQYAEQARAAYERRDFPVAREAMTAALFLRPDSPRYLHNLAAVEALAGDDQAALKTLDELAALGLAPALERDPDFARLQGTPGFLRLLGRLRENREPRGAVFGWAELPGRTGVIEGIAYRPSTKDVFLGDVHHRCIWRRDPSGSVVQFHAADEAILGVFGLALDEPRQTLWAAVAAVPEMEGYTPEQKGHTGLAEFDLANGELRRVVALAGDGRQNALGDLVVAPDGTVYATDFKAPIIWKLAPGAEEFQKVADAAVFASLQGLALQGSMLVVADHANGLFAVELATGNVSALPPPKHVTLLGLDGLVATPDGLLATQNGVQPARVLRIALTPAADAVTAVTVLASGQPELDDLSLLTMIDGRPGVVAGSGWEAFDPAKTPHPAPHPVRLLQIVEP